MASPHSSAPTVSVIIPTCNRLDMLVRSVSSVLAQTAPPLEIIVVNDAGTPVDELLASLNAGGTIRWASHSTNKGAAAARNTALAMARGDYIAYLDDDDVYRPEHLATVVPALHASGRRFGYAFAEYVIDDIRNGELVEVGRVQPYTGIPYSRERLLVANFIPTPTWVFARSLVEEVGTFDESFAACEDWEWLIRASEKTDFLSVQAVTVEVRQRLYDEQHLILQHRPKMNMWIQAVYAKHPTGSAALRLARHEHITFGSAKDLEPSQHAVVDAAFEGSLRGDFDLLNLVGAAELLEGAHRRHRAIELYRTWLANHPGSPLAHAAWFNLGVLLQNMGQAAEAEQAYRQVLAHHDGFEMARVALGDLLERRGNVDEALELWRTARLREQAGRSLIHMQADERLKRYLEV